MLNRTPRTISPEVYEAEARIEAAAQLLSRGLLALAPLDECVESALLWLGQAALWLERAA
jgi:hypothetical protein